MILFNKRTKLTISRVILGVMLFAQAIVVVQACSSPGMDINQVFSHEAMPTKAMEHDKSTPCCPDRDTTCSKNVCLENIVRNDKIDYVFPLPSFTANALDLPLLFVIPNDNRTAFNYRPVFLGCSSDPPLSIRFCSFQT